MTWYDNVRSKAFWAGAGERAAKTFLQVLVTVLLVDATAGKMVTPDAFLAMPWATAVLTGAVGALASIVTSLLNPPFVAGEPLAPEVEPRRAV